MSAKTDFLTVDTKKKVLIINKGIDPTPAEQALLTSYIAAGYTQRYYSAARAEAMKKKSKELNEEFEKLMAENPEAKRAFEKEMAKSDKNYMKAKSAALKVKKAQEQAEENKATKK